MSDLLSINVNSHVEKKNNLTYLSWAWAWSEVLKHDPEATWEAVEYGQPDGTTSPCMYMGGGSAMVKTKVTIKGKTRYCLLPVMDHRNKAILNPDAFAINTAIMRCMTKAISMHGLGLYIYAGEDLPEADKPDSNEVKPPTPKGNLKITPTMGVMATLPADRQAVLHDCADAMRERYVADDVIGAFEIYISVTDGEEKVALWGALGADSKLRAAVKKHGESLRLETA